MHLDVNTGASTGSRPWVRSYIAVVVAMMAIQAASLGFSPLIPFMKDAWDMSYTQVGTFTGVYGIVALIMSVPAGLLAKRYGEKRVLWSHKNDAQRKRAGAAGGDRNAEVRVQQKGVQGQLNLAAAIQADGIRAGLSYG